MNPLLFVYKRRHKTSLQKQELQHQTVFFPCETIIARVLLILSLLPLSSCVYSHPPFLSHGRLLRQQESKHYTLAQTHRTLCETFHLGTEVNIKR